MALVTLLMVMRHKSQAVGWWVVLCRKKILHKEGWSWKSISCLFILKNASCKKKKAIWKNWTLPKLGVAPKKSWNIQWSYLLIETNKNSYTIGEILGSTGNAWPFFYGLEQRTPFFFPNDVICSKTAYISFNSLEQYHQNTVQYAIKWNFRRCCNFEWAPNKLL